MLVCYADSTSLNAWLDFLGDLWGPLLVCLMLSTTLSLTAPGSSASLVFAAVFVIVWCGAAMVTINAQLLGGSISFFQSVCILGYCVFPLTLAAILCVVLSFLINQVCGRILTVSYLTHFFRIAAHRESRHCGRWFHLEHQSVRCIHGTSNQWGETNSGSISCLLFLHIYQLDDHGAIIISWRSN